VGVCVCTRNLREFAQTDVDVANVRFLLSSTWHGRIKT
jgi:hypothetical protein